MHVFYHKGKKNLCTSVLQCWILQCQTYEAEAWGEIPVPKSGNQSSHVLHWEKQKSDLHIRIESIEDAVQRTFPWNAQFAFWSQGCSKTMSFQLGSQLEILLWKWITHFCSTKLLKRKWERTCVCACMWEFLGWNEWKEKDDSAPYLSPSKQQHSGQKMLSWWRHRVNPLLNWKGLKSVPWPPYSILFIPLQKIMLKTIGWGGGRGKKMWKEQQMKRERKIKYKCLCEFSSSPNSYSGYCHQ